MRQLEEENRKRHQILGGLNLDETLCKILQMVSDGQDMSVLIDHLSWHLVRRPSSSGTKKGASEVFYL